MAMLLYMPWCRIDFAYRAGDVTILPFDPAHPVANIDSATWGRVCSILAVYKDIQGNSVGRAALVQLADKSVMDDLTQDEIDRASDAITLACFSALASREYFKPHLRYCNSDCFTFYLQKSDGTEATAISTRRRDGRTLSGWRLSDIAISVLSHCHNVADVAVDSALLDALMSYRAATSAQDWGRWQNALSCFNMANTDNEAFREQVEWVLLCSAFEHLLGASPQARDVARLFDVLIVPSTVMTANKSARLGGRQLDQDVSLRYEWMREFYRLRGDFAHGRLVSQQPMAWSSSEHLMLGVIAFPLVVKTLLGKAAVYQLTDEDLAQTDCFESLAEADDFLAPPEDQTNGWDSKWERLLDHRRGQIASENLENDLLAARDPHETRPPTSEKNE